jgi:hydrogenase expression/formation protein HypC
MCIGVPMEVIEAWPGGALALGRGRRERIDTRLVGELGVGQWVLVFQGAAREGLDEARAAEVNAALDLLESACAGDVDRAMSGDPGFELPSRWSADDLAALAGTPRHTLNGENP